MHVTHWLHVGLMLTAEVIRLNGRYDHCWFQTYKYVMILLKLISF